MLRIVYVVLKTATPYYDRTADYEALMVKRNVPRWIRMLRRYGCRPRERGRTQGCLIGPHNATRLRGASFGPNRGSPPLVTTAPKPATDANPTTVAVGRPRASRSRNCLTAKSPTCYPAKPGDNTGPARSRSTDAQALDCKRNCAKLSFVRQS